MYNEQSFVQKTHTMQVLSYGTPQKILVDMFRYNPFPSKDKNKNSLFKSIHDFTKYILKFLKQSLLLTNAFNFSLSGFSRILVIDG